MKTLLFAGLAAVALAMSPSAAALEQINVNGTQRAIKVHVPEALPAGAPLVIACHGANQSADWHDEHSAWKAVADTAKFVLVFPNAVNSFWDISGNSDVNFILAIIDEMHSRHDINLNRVYMSGFSMGGMLTYHCANSIPEHIAAFVPVSGYPMGDKSALSSRPVPILHVHGTGDDVCVFSGVQPTLDNWIKRNGCRVTPEVIKPYPSDKPGSLATLTRWTDGLDGVEVSLLQIEGKGHWQSEDAAHAMTSVEAWNFMRRWSLGPEPPRVVGTVPEDGSFDLPIDGTDITLTFDGNVSAEGVEAVLSGVGGSHSLSVNVSGARLSLAVPPLAAGEYTLTVRNVKGENDGVLKIFQSHYTFGVEEVGDVPSEKIHLQPDWRAEQAAVGEGIPTGWHRVNSRASGDKDEKESGTANTGGARMKYFVAGGDFAEGFYLSARDYDRCDISYGRYPDYRLHLTAGRYTATFNSAYWNEGSMNGDSRFDFSVARLDGRAVAVFPSLKSACNLAENSNRTITGSYAHTCEFEIEEEGDYTVTFSMSTGWAAVIVGNLRVATSLSAAERYKGAFMRTLSEAREVYASIDADRLTAPASLALRDAIGRYADFVSTSPSEYTAATDKLAECIEAVRTGMSAVAEIGGDTGIPVRKVYFNVCGQQSDVPYVGVNIVRMYYSDGQVKTLKRVYR